MNRQTAVIVELVVTVAAMLAPGAFACAQVHYHEGGHPWNQRADSGPDAEVPGWYYNLGITGMRAELVSAEPKSLVIRYVFANSPAHGLVLAGDRIVGAGGQLFREAHRNGYGEDVFGATGPIEDFATALGVFSKIAGLVWGRVEHWSDEGCPISVEDLLLEAIRGELGRDPAFPIATDFDCCHTTPMLTLAQGVRVRLDTQGAAARVTALEPAVVG